MTDHRVPISNSISSCSASSSPSRLTRSSPCTLPSCRSTSSRSICRQHCGRECCSDSGKAEILPHRLGHSTASSTSFFSSFPERRRAGRALGMRPSDPCDPMANLETGRRRRDEELSSTGIVVTEEDVSEHVRPAGNRGCSPFARNLRFQWIGSQLASQHDALGARQVVAFGHIRFFVTLVKVQADTIDSDASTRLKDPNPPFRFLMSPDSTCASSGASWADLTKAEREESG